MKSRLLLPRYFRIVGWIMAVPGLVLGGLFQFDDRFLPFLDYGSGHQSNPLIGSAGGNNFTDEIATTLAIAGLLFIGFSRFRDENERTKSLRLKALYWAALVNTAIISVLMMDLVRTFRGTGFAINNSLILLLIVFIGRLYYLRFKRKEQTNLFYLPHRPFNLFGKISTIIFIVAIFAVLVFDLKPAGPDFLLYLIFPCIVLWIWSKEKHEEEQTEGLRLKAMQLSLYINCSAFIVLTWVVYGFNYLAVQFAGLVSVQLIFLVLFYFLVFKAVRSGNKENSITGPVIS